MVVVETERGPWYLSPADPERFCAALRARMSLCCWRESGDGGLLAVVVQLVLCLSWTAPEANGMTWVGTLGKVTFEKIGCQCCSNCCYQCKHHHPLDDRNGIPTVQEQFTHGVYRISEGVPAS